MNIVNAVELAKKKDDQGITYLYEATYQKCYYVALKYLKNVDAAMDVLQDAYIKAFNNIDKLESPEKFEGWMKAIVATTSLNELRRNNPMLFSETENEDGETIEDTFEDDRIEVQPEIAMDKKETSRLVQEMMEGLSDEQRICITMFYMEEMSVKEIAEILNVSENTVKSRLNYGRKNIKEKVLELEKKGTKLYGVAPFIFFLLLFKKDAKACSVKIPAMKAASSAAGSTASTTSAGVATAGKTIGSVVATKQFIAAVAAIVILGGSAASIAAHNNSKNAVPEQEEIVAEAQVEEPSTAVTEEVEVEEPVQPEIMEEPETDETVDDAVDIDLVYEADGQYEAGMNRKYMEDEYGVIYKEEFTEEGFVLYGTLYNDTDYLRTDNKGHAFKTDSNTQYINSRGETCSREKFIEGFEGNYDALNMLYVHVDNGVVTLFGVSP